jgi:hypothetical protein
MSPIRGNNSTDEEAQLLGADESSNEDYGLPLHRTQSQQGGLLDLLNGPDPPKVHSIHPFLPALQEAPVRLLEVWKIDKRALLSVVLLLWFFLFAGFLAAQLPLEDAEGRNVVNLDCVDTLWWRKNECGIDGVNCHPFDNRTFAFRCPSKCRGVQILNPRHVGPVDVNYRPLVIGSGPYRGDSFICGSAIHAGIIDNAKGGCGRVSLVGSHTGFASTKQHGIESIAFDSDFPLSYSIASDDGFRCASEPRSTLLVVSLIFTAILAIFSASPLVFFPIYVLIFAHVSFVSDPPSASYRNSTVLPDHLSMFAKRLLPAIFVAIVVYRAIVKKTLSGITAQFEKTLFWLGGFWVGALSNYTFDWIPISRLSAHDLSQQPGAKLALLVIILALAGIIISQAYSFWREGRLLRYLGIYGIFIGAILLCLLIPGVNLRIHHYILALLLLPGTTLQTRRSLLYQGILLGLFVNGVARWDFDSVLQTSEALRADAELNSEVPTSLMPLIESGVNGLVVKFTWNPPPEFMDGISVMVNDVERDRAWFDDGEPRAGREFEWERPPGPAVNEYFRWAYLKDGRTLDYSKAGVLSTEGVWTPEDTSS